jgi:hypothetical protein
VGLVKTISGEVSGRCSISNAASLQLDLAEMLV